MNVLAFARDLPKVELHCHLEGAARPSTIADLARANGVALPTDDPLVATGEHPLVQPHVLTKVGRPPASVYLTLDFPMTGRRLAILFVCQPETLDRTRVYKLMAHDGLAPNDLAAINDLIAYEDLVLDEDLAILERMPKMTLATDPRVEVHSTADKLSVAYRRTLADIQELP